MNQEDARAQFPTLDQLLWLNMGGGGPQSRLNTDRICEAVELMNSGDLMQFHHWYQATRVPMLERIARLINVDQSGLVVTRSTSHGLGLLAGGLDWRPGDNVVVADPDFPSNVYPWMRLESKGVEFRRLIPKDGKVTADLVADMLDERTRVLSLSYVHFWNGYRIDTDAIGQVCRDNGTYFCLDAIQGIGATRLDASQVDLVACGAQKWMLGTFGVGFAYVAPALAEKLEPVLVGLGGMTQPQDNFAPQLQYAGGAQRFHDSPTSWFNLVAMGAGLELLDDYGFDKVERRVIEMTTRIGQELTERGHQITDPWPRTPKESSGLISFRTPGVDPRAQQAALIEKGILIQSYGDFARVSPHFFISDDDITRFLETLLPPTS